jgi:hypothetical protein
LNAAESFPPPNPAPPVGRAVGRAEAPARGLNVPDGRWPPKPPVVTPCFLRQAKYALIDDDEDDEVAEDEGEVVDDAPHAVSVRARATTAKIRARGNGIQLLLVRDGAPYPTGI